MPKVNTCFRVLTVAATVYATAPTAVMAAQKVPAPTKYIVFGVGTASCGRWVEAPKDSLPAEGYLAWVLGFLSGAGWAGADTIRDIDNDAIKVWMNNYCQAHPLDSIAMGAQALALELKVK